MLFCLYVILSWSSPLKTLPFIAEDLFNKCLILEVVLHMKEPKELSWDELWCSGNTLLSTCLFIPWVHSLIFLSKISFSVISLSPSTQQPSTVTATKECPRTAWVRRNWMFDWWTRAFLAWGPPLEQAGAAYLPSYRLSILETSLRI